MKNDLDKNKQTEDEEGSGQSGSGSSGSKIKIHLRGGDTQRDDQLSPSELRRLLIVLAEAHKARVDKQRRLRAERREKKDPGELNAKRNFTLGQGGGSGSRSPYKQHPLSKTAQFSGIDKQTSPIPSDAEQNTNDDKKNELENRLENKLQNRLTLQNQKKFIPPTPRPY